MRRFVDVVQGLTGIAVIVAVVMLFANSPTSPPAPAAEAEIDIPAAIDAAGVYGSSCAGCHGGDGSGGIGPPLKSARMADRFPDPADQVAVIGDGRGRMPAFGGRLSADEIDAVVVYTRTSLP